MNSFSTNHIAVDVEISIIPYSKESHLKFNPNNPFIMASHRPLTNWDFCTKFDLGFSNNDKLYWVIEEELITVPPGLDLKKAFNCFNTVPTVGASYSLKLCLDLPDNQDPDALPLATASETGHTFVVITKKNGAKSVTQVFGFYAEKHPGYIDPWRPMVSIIRNNQLREINASIEMGLTETQFQLLREKALELAKQKYSVASYNCTNYALDLFNSLRAKPITINSYKVYLPNNNNFYGTAPINTLEIDKTPQRLFQELNKMKNSKNSEAANIVIDQTGKSKAPLSSGECN